MKTLERRFKSRTPFTDLDFESTRLGEIMRPKSGESHEAWGVLDPGGVRAPDGSMHLFSRLIAEGNYSRIGHARVIYDEGKPTSVERLGIALEPHEPYEVSAGGGGVEDPRVVYIAAIERYVMTYTAFRSIRTEDRDRDLERPGNLGAARRATLREGAIA